MTTADRTAADSRRDDKAHFALANSHQPPVAPRAGPHDRPRGRLWLPQRLPPWHVPPGHPQPLHV